MEGVVDSGLRAVLTGIGGYDRCVTEFVRVTEQLLPAHVFKRFAPELEHGGHTPAGTPVYIQLLGGNAKYMALNALRAQELDPPGIDLNFGCPSKTVNKSDGGSALLREPQRVGDIIRAVRDAVDPAIPVTAKIRLGLSNHDDLNEIVDQVVAAGASELCIHARTRDDRYKPPAHWHVVKAISDRVEIPIVINGEIWSVEDAYNALKQSGCQHIMLGRGALSCPDLANSIKHQTNSDSNSTPAEVMTWPEVLELMVAYLSDSQHKHPMFVSNRAKQWLVFLQMHFSEAAELFHLIKRTKPADEVFAAIRLFQKNSPSAFDEDSSS